MTAEIAIMNRNAVALAADSAFTVGKTVRVGNKLFSLSPANDIGVMIYGSADYLSYSWEVLIKSFRRKVGSKEYDTVKECADDFIDYVKSDLFQDDDLEDLSFMLVIMDALEMVKRSIPKGTSTNKRDAATLKEIRRITKSLKQHREVLPKHISLPKFKAEYTDKSTDLALDILKVDFKNKPRNLSALLNFLHTVLARKIDSDYSTGIVFAGYGGKQFFPELTSYIVDGKLGDNFRIWEGKSRNLNKKGDSGATIIPFAQSDMFQVFMEGIAGEHHEFIHYTLKKILDDKSKTIVKNYVSDADEKAVETALQKQDNDKILKEFTKEFKKYISKNMISPVMGVIETLPKEEMAAMAEALIEITTLRRKVDSSVETVGGPTDVAVISKGDGIIWIKRKHYFKAEMNQDFIQRKASRHGVLNENES